MLQLTTGDILGSQADALVNTVNCVGVMGRGVALQFKNAFPENFKAYEAACRKGEVQPGSMFVFETGQVVAPKYIINFPTKRHWRGKSRMEDIDSGLEDLIRVVKDLRIHSIAIPPLGSGLGGLDWPQVRDRIIRAFISLPDVGVIVFEPRPNQDSQRIATLKPVPRMTPGRAALVELIHTYLSGLLDPFVTLLEVHKLMYFLQEAGEPLRLNFKKAEYGPYADNLRHVLHAVEGHLVSGYADGGDAPTKQLTLVPGAVADAAEFLESHPETRDRFRRVSRLVEGFESPFGMELLATVHWTLKAEGIGSMDSLVASVHGWNRRKQQISRRQIERAARTLTEHGWIET